MEPNSDPNHQVFFTDATQLNSPPQAHRLHSNQFLQSRLNGVSALQGIPNSVRRVLHNVPSLEVRGKMAQIPLLSPVLARTAKLVSG